MTDSGTVITDIQGSGSWGKLLFASLLPFGANISREACYNFANASEGQHLNPLHDSAFTTTKYNNFREPIIPGLFLSYPVLLGIEATDGLPSCILEFSFQNPASANMELNYELSEGRVLVTSSDNSVIMTSCFKSLDEKLKSDQYTQSGQSWQSGECGAGIALTSIASTSISLGSEAASFLQNLFYGAIKDSKYLKHFEKQLVDGTLLVATERILPFLVFPKAMYNLIYEENAHYETEEAKEEFIRMRKQIQANQLPVFSRIEINARQSFLGTKSHEIELQTLELKITEGQFKARGILTQIAEGDEGKDGVFDIKAEGNFIVPAFILENVARIDDISVRRNYSPKGVFKVPEYARQRRQRAQSDRLVQNIFNAIVVGASKPNGIGYSIAYALSQIEGANIVITGRDNKFLSRKDRNENKTPLECLSNTTFRELDVANLESVEKFRQIINEMNSPVKYLVYCPAYMHPRAMSQKVSHMTEQDAMDAYKVTVQGYKNIVKGLESVLDGGSVLYLSTGTGKATPNYNLSEFKAAGEQATLQMAYQYGKNWHSDAKGIQFNVLCLPPVETYSGQGVPFLPDMIEVFKAGAFLGLPTLQEMGQAAALLLQVPKMTGQILHIDGGYSGNSMPYNVTDAHSGIHPIPKP